MGNHGWQEAGASAPVTDARGREAGLERAETTALLRRLGDVAGEHVLILGRDVDLMCGLIRRGCAEVTELDQNHRPDTGSADLIVVVDVRSDAAAVCAVSHARRALAPAGRIAVHAAANPSAYLTRSIMRALRLHGFRQIGFGPIGAGTIVTAERPMGALAGVKSAGRG